jgi:hypothetical protein
MKGKAYANRKPESERPAGDFYETPSCMVKELLESGLFFRPAINMRIFDPCCGNHKIGNVLRQYGHSNITEKDIMYGDDFLAKDDNGNYLDLTEYDVIIMNPPFKLFDEFVKKAKMQAHYVFCIGKMNFFGAHNRNVEGLWKGLKWVLPFDRMIAFDQPEIDGKCSVGMIVSNWFIWDWEYEQSPRIKVLDVQKYIRRK